MTNLVPRSLVDEAEGEISPSASFTRDLGTRLVNDSNKSNVNIMSYLSAVIMAHGDHC